MKKNNRVKTAIIVMMAVGILCACGNNEVSESRGSVGDVPEPTVTTMPATQSEPGNDPVSGKIVTTEVESVSVRFYIGYNIATGDAISDTIPCNTVEVSGDALTELSEILPELCDIRDSLHPENMHPEDTEYILHHIMDFYELTINDDLVLDIANEYGICNSTGVVFQVPAELYEIVNSIVEEYSENNVYGAWDTEQITVTNRKGQELEITDPEQLEKLLSNRYYTINADDEMFEGEDVAYVMDLHNGDELDVHFSSVLGKLRHADGSYEYVYTGNMEDDLNRIFTE